MAYKVWDRSPVSTPSRGPVRQRHSLQWHELPSWLRITSYTLIGALSLNLAMAAGRNNVPIANDILNSEAGLIHSHKPKVCTDAMVNYPTYLDSGQTVLVQGLFDLCVEKGDVKEQTTGTSSPPKFLVFLTGEADTNSNAAQQIVQTYAHRRLRLIFPNNPTDIIANETVANCQRVLGGKLVQLMQNNAKKLADGNNLTVSDLKAAKPSDFAYQSHEQHYQNSTLTINGKPVNGSDGKTPVTGAYGAADQTNTLAIDCDTLAKGMG